MTLTFDLNRRQAARMLSQAQHCSAQLQIEPRHRADAPALAGSLEAVRSNLLRVRLDDSDDKDDLSALVGAFCDVQIALTGQMFLFSSCIMDVAINHDSRTLLIAIPESTQLCNRRKFERTNATIASQVHLWAAEQESASVGLLHNISAEGLACVMPDTALDDVLLLGDEVRVRFELAGFDEIFQLPATVCNKSFCKKRGTLEVGVEFAVAADNTVDNHTLERLRYALFELMTGLANLDGQS